jgi:hydroxymethylglutaryl-CoA lyase
VLTAYGEGIRIFDGAASGLGGCPFAPGAPGNVATEAIVAAFEDRGIRTGVDQQAVIAAARHLRSTIAAPAP